MKTYLLLLRGINVGGKNKVPMTVLKDCLTELGFSNVTTYLASGNVILQSDKTPAEIKKMVETTLPKTFALDNELVKVLVLTNSQLAKLVANKPQGFGDQPGIYHSDVIFMMNIHSSEAMPLFNPREGVDTVWQGDGVIYSQRLSAKLTKSRLSTVTMSPLYKSMTIRSWNTTIKLLNLARALANKAA